MTFGSLFSGIGGLDLGLERAGLVCRWQVERDEYCRKVLARHWPGVPKFDDVQTVGAHNLERVDCIAGGFPCQDISFAGDGAGLAGDRSGLWFQFDRLIGELRPRFVLVENVAALVIRGLDTVLANLAARGFDADWSPVPACALGSTHTRQRLFIVAHANGEHGRPWIRHPLARAFRPLQTIDGFESARAGAKARLANPSELYGGADGVPCRMERNRAIGNAVSPAVAEWIGRRLMEAAT